MSGEGEGGGGRRDEMKRWVGDEGVGVRGLGVVG